jgi:hypothetical protein
MPKGTYELIATANPAGTTVATFSNIPQTYTDLVAFLCAGNTQTGAAYAAVEFRFNGDSANNYGGVTMYNFGGNFTPQAGGGPSSSYDIRTSVPDGAGLTTAQLDILNYSSTTTSKPFIVRSGQGDWEALRYDAKQGVWLNTSALTSITFTVSANNYRAGSYIALYGIGCE